MGMFEKLDELIEKLNEPEEITPEVIAPEADAANVGEGENVINTPIAENAAQNESSEDAPANEAIDKLSKIVDLQQQKIDSLNNQIAQLVQAGANINDGKQAQDEIVSPPENVPSDYEYLKDLDYTM